jgi:aminopeptidase N
MFDRHSYQKGGRVLHMLRNYVGDEAFFAALKKYLTNNKFKSVEVANLRLAFEEVTGEDLMWFFDQWFMKPGHPELKVDQQYENGKLTVRVFQQQDTLYTPLYKLPVKIAFWNGGKKTEQPVTISKYRNIFEIPVSAKPELVILDPDAQLLATIQHEKTEAELIHQFYHAERFQHKVQALNLLTDKVSVGRFSGCLKYEVLEAAQHCRFCFQRQSLHDRCQRERRNRKSEIQRSAVRKY